MVRAEKMPRGSTYLNMVFDKMGEGGGGEKARLARLARTILVAYMKPKRFFFILLAGNSPVQPLAMAIATAAVAAMATAMAATATATAAVAAMATAMVVATVHNNQLKGGGNSGADKDPMNGDRGVLPPRICGGNR